MNEARKRRIKILQEYLIEDPLDRFSKYALSLEYMQSDETDDAILLLKELVEIFPDFLASYYQLGKAFEKKMLVNEAIVIYKEGIALAKKQMNQHTENELKAALMMLDDSDGN